jgi:hypothetical protein
MDDTRHLGKLFEVLGLDENGRPKDTGDPLDADLRPLAVADLVALQGRVTAEFARRLGRMANPGPDDLDLPRPNLRENLGRYNPEEGRQQG